MRGYAAGGPMSQTLIIAPISVTTSLPRYAFRISLRFWRWIMASVIIALLAACSGGAAPTPALAPTSTPVPALAPSPNLPLSSPPTLAPTPTAILEFGLLLNEPESFEGYTLFSPAYRNYAYLIDHQGRLAHTWPSGPVGVGLARLLDNGNVLSSDNIESDPDGNIVWEFRFPQHHDLLKLPNGNVLILSREFLSREEAIDLGANPDSLVCSPSRMDGLRIVEARPTGPESAEIVWEWSVFDHLIQDFDPEKPNYGVVADHPERVDLNFALAQAPCPNGARWTHANALDYHPELDQIMITVRHFSEIWIIDHSANRKEAAGSAGGAAGKGGDLLYRWGNPRAYRAGTPADQRLFFPHAAHWIPEGSPGAGNVLVFNNGGSEVPGFKRGYSSVDEFVLPHDGYNYRLGAGSAYGPAELAWTYAADPPEAFYAYKESGAQRLPNGNTLITDGPAARIFEVTREGKTVWDFTFPSSVTGLYRAYRYSPDYPGLRGLDLTPLRTLHREAVKGEPLADALFDLYAADGYLFYAKEQCGPDDLARFFYLHILPEQADDLQETQRWRGFNNIIDLEPYLTYELRESLSDGKCAARTPLPDYPVAAFRTGQQTSEGRALWSAQVWMNPEPYQTAYVEAVEGEPLARSTFNLYLQNGELVYAKEQCEQDDIEHPFYLHILPESVADLPESRRRHGFDNLDFDFFLRGALFDVKCAARVPLPDYAVAAIRTGQKTPDGGVLWTAQFAAEPEPYRTAYVEAVEGEPLARSTFNLYAADGALVYAKERCEQDDITHRFFLHIVPERPDDLPEAQMEVGFENLDFEFFFRGALFDGKCAARVPLPDYSVASVRTGQFSPGGELWSVDVAFSATRR